MTEMRRVVIGGLLISAALGALLSPLASSAPDGLEKVAEHLGFIRRGEGDPALAAPVPDYALPGVESEVLATAVSGLLGVAASFSLAWMLGMAMKRRKRASRVRR